MAFSRGWHPLAMDVISASMGMGREKGQLGIPLSLAASCIKNTSPCCPAQQQAALSLSLVSLSCPRTSYCPPRSPSSSCCPVSCQVGALTSPQQLVSILKSTASSVLEMLVGLTAAGGGEETTRVPPKAGHWYSHTGAAKPSSPFPPFSQVAGSLLGCWLRWLRCS